MFVVLINFGVVNLDADDYGIAMRYVNLYVILLGESKEFKLHQYGFDLDCLLRLSFLGSFLSILATVATNFVNVPSFVSFSG